ncbi:hypothetical protein ACFE04_025014 [Oxalis oulophora]
MYLAYYLLLPDIETLSQEHNIPLNLRNVKWSLSVVDHLYLYLYLYLEVMRSFDCIQDDYYIAPAFLGSPSGKAFLTTSFKLLCYHHLRVVQTFQVYKSKLTSRVF